MLGTGMDIVGGQGEVGAYSIIPEIDAAGRAIDVEVNAAEIDPLATSWEVHAFAICADDVYPQQVIYADHSVTSDGSAGLTVYCPFGTVATGTGYDVPDAVGEIIVNSIDPGGSKTHRNRPHLHHRLRGGRHVLDGNDHVPTRSAPTGNTGAPGRGGHPPRPGAHRGEAQWLRAHQVPPGPS